MRPYNVGVQGLGPCVRLYGPCVRNICTRRTNKHGCNLLYILYIAQYHVCYNKLLCSRTSYKGVAMTQVSTCNLRAPHCSLVRAPTHIT